jgi:hypothetical protein
MKKQLPDEVMENVTTEATLIELTEHVTRVLENGTLDTRLASKIAKQLRKGTDELASNTWTKDGYKAIKKALATLDEALIAQQSKTLVKTLAKLRDEDEA